MNPYTVAGLSYGSLERHCFDITAYLLHSVEMSITASTRLPIRDIIHIGLGIN